MTIKATEPDTSAVVDTSPAQGLSTQSVHAGEHRQKHGDAITDAIFCSSTYTFPDTQSVIDFIEHKLPREEYGRYGNPGEKFVEAKLAALEGGESAVLFASGMAAIVGLLMAKLNAGDEVVFFDECYHRSREFCVKHLARFGVVTRQVPACDYDAMQAAITPQTRLLISESPTNPHLSIVDLKRFVQIGRDQGVETLIDATLATPVNLRPIEAGVDYVLHSATKYLGGHNDLLAGTIIGRADRLEPVRNLRGIMGAVNSPHNVYLLTRGLKTLELRMRRHNENGLAVAEFLEGHSRVERVYYPGLPSHPYHEVARRTMLGYGGLVTFLVKDADWQQTAAVVDAVKIPRIGPSLGGVESLIEQPLVMSYYECTPEERERFGIPDNMIRLACGIENTKDLIDDLAQALEQ
ncbi:MAG: cystathionine gamma-synthase [Planctomycetales bacterium]|nr:cystathionine gamma-synthase [Planctomycetales bacterium]NIM07659.1 cystathionine gamma-synthase [Planctomycetales bacterium]NIN07164.1 cystathionine gamma-synthase [Planctomycetales bacterium]NIN76257.1 cystathionine gamma-synthase [Planctomycetales bacterium]NIO33473.1 cystathionine gamma-synthase [Planctomycetales bacterium]